MKKEIVEKKENQKSSEVKTLKKSSYSKKKRQRKIL